MGIPVTATLIAAFALAFLVAWFAQGNLAQYFALTSDWPNKAPLAILVYPFASTGNGRELLNWVFLCFWMYMVGGIVERDLGAKRYVVFLLFMTVLVGLAVFLGMELTHRESAVFGPWALATAVTVLWGSRYPTAIVRLMMIFPISGMWLAILSVALLAFPYGPALSAFAAAPMVLPWLYATERIPFLPYKPQIVENPTRGQVKVDDKYFTEVTKRELEREERARLKKLFDSEMSDDDPRNR